MFSSIGIHPVEDYVCDRGRTRVLQLPIPGERDAIEQLCIRVLTEVYSIRCGDTLDYHLLTESDVRS